MQAHGLYVSLYTIQKPLILDPSSIIKTSETRTHDNDQSNSYSLLG